MSYVWLQGVALGGPRDLFDIVGVVCARNGEMFRVRDWIADLNVGGVVDCECRRKYLRAFSHRKKQE